MNEPAQQEAPVLPSNYSTASDTLARILPALRNYRPPSEQMDDLREQIRSTLAALYKVSGPSPEALRAGKAAQGWLSAQPRKPQPTHVFIAGLEAALRELRKFCPPPPVLDAPVATAAAYTCVPERGDPRAVQVDLEQAASVLGGQMDYYHHDVGLRDWACHQRPGWQRIAHLVAGRHIGLLAVVSPDELLPAADAVFPGAPWTTADGVRRWLADQGVRLACVDEVLGTAGTAGGC
ncbi:hypothetical protein AB0G73_24230 [Streptomyces sp. NPDC020719]|uniref:hypothetical protein n=1 Tax=Streptomyces sp. NPDC020719 TaxID=3154896 RepID=UPI0033C52EAE